MLSSLSEPDGDDEGEGEAELGGRGDGEVEGGDEELSRFEAPLPDQISSC